MPTPTRALNIAALTVFLLLPCAGCSASQEVSMSSWRESVTRYVREEAHGDPMILRTVTLADDRPGYAVIGHHDTEVSTDANGLLLGHEHAGERMWLVYLVGLVEKQKVTDIALAALSAEKGRIAWRSGKGSKQSLEAYRAHGLKQARERFPDRKSAPPRYTTFPRPDDVFKLESADGKFIATHEATGARWEVSLENPKR